MNIDEIFELSKEKTRVLITENSLQKLLYFIINFTEKEVDFVTESHSNISGNDFLFFFTENLKEAANLKPNIVLLSNEIPNQEKISEILREITGGGVLIYPEENKFLSETIMGVENYFRKIPYTIPDYETYDGNLFLKTEMGNIPMDYVLLKDIKILDGIRLLCQQLGIMEEEFHEALISYNL